MNNLLKVSIGFVLPALLIGCNRSEEPVQTKVIKKVATVTARQVDYQREVFATGMVSLNKEVKLSFKTGGIISRVYVDEGQTVKLGQTLAQLKLEEIKAQADNAELQYEKVQRDMVRTQALFNDSVATLEQLQDVQTQLKAARNTYESAQFNLRYSFIKAPYNGVVLSKLADENELVGAGTPVFYFGAQDQTKQLNVYLTAREIGKVALGNEARVVFDALPGQEFTGKVTEKNEIADAQTNTFAVEIKLYDPEGKLYSGFVGKAYIASAAAQSVIKIPIDALKEAHQTKASVFVLREGIARKKEIEILAIQGEHILLKSGLIRGEVIITEGVGYLADGDSLQARSAHLTSGAQ